MRIGARILFGLGFVTGAATAVAAPVTVEFGGVIDFVEQGLPVGDQVAVGVAYSGIYQFDPEGVENSSGLPTVGGYQFGTAGFMSVDIASINITTPDLLVVIENSSLLDMYKVGNSSPFDAHGTTWLEMQLDLRDVTHTAFDSTELPLGAPDINEFEFSQLFYLLQPNRRDPSITGTVTYLNMVPEPTSLAMLFTTAAMVSLRRRHPRRSP